MNHPKKNAKKLTVTLMTIRKWHWMSAALCFVCMLLFAVTGITLHHARDWLPKAEVTHIVGDIPRDKIAEFSSAKDAKNIKVSPALSKWIAKDLNVSVSPERAEIKSGDLVIALNRPGVSMLLNIDLESGAYDLETSDRGVFGYLNDLHKGKGTGKSWVYFIDVFAVGCIIFAITGFILLQRYANTRAQTWPLLAASLVLPVFFMMFLIH